MIKIKRLRIPNGGESPFWIELLDDSETCENSLHVLAGPNRSGKSFVLDSLSKAIRRTDFEKSPSDSTGDENGVKAVLNAICNKQLRILVILDIDFIVKKAASVPLALERRRQRFNVETSTRNLCNLFFYDNFPFLFEGNTTRMDDWLSSAETRARILSCLNQEKIYLADPEIEFVASFRRATGGDLFFLKSEKYDRVDFCLKFPGDSTQYTYSNWSYGQKSLFVLLLHIFYFRDGILLVDEIENHLHPQFISHFFEEATIRCLQTIVTSHHPHVIFSKHVTSVHYMATLEGGGRNLQKTQPYLKEISNNRAPLSRIVVHASNDFLKISNVYRLFEAHDAVLLKLSQSSASSMSDVLIESVRRAFENEVKSVSSSTKPDLQSMQFSQIIRQLASRSDPTRVLDFGAGKGRTFLEISKVIPQGGNLEWHFWEPDEKLRTWLKSTVDERKNLVILDGLTEDNTKQSYELIVVSNVLHELNSKEFSKALIQISHLLSESGRLCICELSPLLHPEKYAVSYTIEDLQKILRNLGWIVKSSFLDIRSSSVRAYLMECRSKAPMKSLEEVIEVVRGVWAEILERCCGNYEGRLDIASTDDLVGSLADLTTIASIVSDRTENWS